MKSIKTYRFAPVVLLFSAFASGPVSAQDEAKPTSALHVLRPVSNAFVRETVPIRVAPAGLPSDGYVGVTIDGVFQTARVLPETSRRSGTIFDWDTKAAYTTSDDPDTPKYYADGDHTLKIDLYDRSGNVQGEATIAVHLANKIIVPAQGLKLAYHWSPNLQLHYLRQSQLDTVPVTTGFGQAPQNVEASLIRFSRSVEDTSGGNYLVRDTVLPNSFLISRGQTQRLESAYRIKSKYRTVNSRGDVLRELAPLSPGQHIGFSIPVLPARRVAVGDSWQAPVQLSLDWAGAEVASITAESRLEGFEWQNGYQSAKIRETYSGPVSFRAATATGTSFDAQTVKYERIVFFAYNSGRLVHTQANVDITADLPPAVVSALGLGGGGGASATGNNTFANSLTSAYANLLQGDPEAQQAPPQGQYPGAAPNAAPLTTDTKLKVTDITNVLT